MTKKATTPATAAKKTAKPKVATNTTGPAPVNKGGRPRGSGNIYDRRAVMTRICEMLATSERGVSTILKEEPDMPAMSKFWEWLDEKEKDGVTLTQQARGLREMYARAKQLQAEYMEALLLEIVDDSRNDFMEKADKDGVTFPVVDHEHIQRTRLRVDTRKWLMAKLHPKKYADSIKVGGDDELPPVKSESEVKVSHSFDDLRAALAKSLAKKPDA